MVLKGRKNSSMSVSSGVKSSVALFLSSVVTSGIAYLTTPIYTRILPAEIFGQVNVFMTWLNIFGVIAMFCLMNGVFNNGMVDFPERRDEYSYSMLGLSNLITICFGLLLIAHYPVIKEYIQIKPAYLALMFIIFFFQPSFNFWSARQRYEYKYKALVFWSILLALLSPIFAIIAILFFKEDKLSARIFGAYLPMILVYVGFYFYLGRKCHFRINRTYWKPAFLFNLPLIPHYLSALLLTSSNTLMIAYLVDEKSTAYYSVAFSLSMIMNIVWNAVNASLIPYTYEKCKENDYASISRVTSPLLILFAFLCLILIILAPEIVKIMATAEYLEAIYAISPIIGGAFFQVLYYVFANVIYYYKRPVYVMIASVVAAVLNIALNFVLIPKYGYLVVGYTTLFCYGIQATIDYLAMRHVLGKNIYDMKMIIIVSIVVIAISLLSNLMYRGYYVRYTILLLILVLAVMYRKKIVSILLYKQ